MRLWLAALALAHAAAGAVELRQFEPEDGRAWRILQDERLTPDGRWLVYVLTPDASIANSPLDVAAAGESWVVVRSTRTNVERRYLIGAAPAPGGLRFSPDGSHVAFVRTQEDEKRCVVVEVASGEEREVRPAVDCWFAAGSPGPGVLLAAGPADAAGKAFDLSLHRLNGERRARFEGISSYTLSPDGAQLVTAGADGLVWRDLRRGRTVKLAAPAGGEYTQWTWAPGGRALVALRQEAGGAPQIVLVRGLSASAPQVSVHAADGVRGSFVWRADGKGVFFEFKQPTPAEDPPAKGVAIWHSRADRIPAQVAWDRKRAAVRADLAILWLEDGQIVRLTDGSLEQVQPRARGRYLMGFDSSPYGWRGATDDKTRRRDYYLIDVRTGQRSLLVRNLRVYSRGDRGSPILSPDGGTVVWRDEAGDFIACDLATRETTPLTKSLPVRFYHPENDPRTSPQAVDPQGIWGIQGWAPDRGSVLISDSFDVWELPLRGGSARNLTVDGRKRGIVYTLDYLTIEPLEPQSRYRYPLAKEYAMRYGELPLSPQRPWYFSAREVDTARQGLARLDPGASRVRELTWDEASTTYVKAAQADVWLVLRSSAMVPPDYHLLDDQWRRVRPLTDSNPQQRQFHWPPPPEFLAYETSRGEKRHAVLFLPAGYQTGRRYPTVMFVYQQLSHLAHLYQPFSPELYPWLWSGYAVLMPDIVPRVDEPGKAAVECVSAAIDAAVATGVVDRDRIGLSGHSYGGYETWYIATRTSLVKAAAPYAGMTDLVHDAGVVYNDIYDGQVLGPHPQAELTGRTQPFLTPPWWENREAYFENSPIYHLTELRTPLLIAHGDRDRAVRFSQAETMFNHLRLLGHPNVVLLHYPGEGHDFSPPAYRDFHARLVQFFDHFLKGEPAPGWWADGRSYPSGTAPR